MAKTVNDNFENVKNWQDLKFGMFIHWGLYSKGDIGEWSMYCDPIDVDEYARRADDFTAEKFDAERWTDAAKSAGMRYAVMVAKHHDGFSLWDSKCCKDDFTSMNCPAKRDFVKEYTDACHKAGLLTGLYYSPLDWRFPGFFFPKMYKRSADELSAQAHGQIEEILSNYGRIDILWYDGGEDFWLAHGIHMHKFCRPSDFKTNPQVRDFWNMRVLDKIVRTKQAGIICNDRIGDKSYGDYFAPEKKIGDYNTSEPWETCETLTDTWSYRPNAQIRSLRNCVQLLAKVVCNGGNLLLNVAPKADGSIEEKELARLAEIGEWLDKYGDAVYGTRGGPVKVGAWGGTTNKGNKLYFHVFDWVSDRIYLPSDGFLSAKCLTGAPLSVQNNGDVVCLSVPQNYRQEIDTIIEATYDRTVTDIIADATEYDDIANIAVYKNQAVIVDDV